MELKYITFFVIGGSIVTLVTYLADHSKGIVAAFIANLPLITLTIFLTIYMSSGPHSVIDYAKGLVLMSIPWFFYVFSVIFLSKINFQIAINHRTFIILLNQLFDLKIDKIIIKMTDSDRDYK